MDLQCSEGHGIEGAEGGGFVRPEQEATTHTFQPDPATGYPYKKDGSFNDISVALNGTLMVI